MTQDDHEPEAPEPGHRWRMAVRFAAVLGALLAMAWLGSALGTRSGAESALEDQLRELEHKQSMLANRDVLQAQLAELDDQLADSRRELPSSFDPAAIRLELDGLAVAHGVEITRADAGEEVVKEFYGEQTYVVALRGPPASVYAFLAQVAVQGAAKQVRDLDLEEAAGDGSRIEATLQVTYYRYVEDQPTPTPGAGHAG